MENLVSLPFDISIVSHEIRETATGTLGMANFLFDEKLTPQGQNNLSTICQLTDRLLDLVTEIEKEAKKIPTLTPPDFVKINSLAILLVEDDPIVQHVHIQMLNKIGYRVDIASNGSEALALFQANKYNIILMDIGLPDMNGIQIASEIRRLEKQPEYTPIIALTCYDKESIEAECKEAGIYRIENKPIKREDLQNLIQKTLKEKNI